MNLRNGSITVREILAYKPAYDYLMKELPFLKNHPMLHRADKITLNMAIMFAGDAVSKTAKQQMLDTLKKL